MSGSAAKLADRLAHSAEAVCRYYLSAGRRQGNYWLAGDVNNTEGRSLFVRLTGPRAGKWTDYVAPQVMLRPRPKGLFYAGSAASAQHNLSSGSVA